MHSVTSELQNFKTDHYDPLLITTLVVVSAVLLVDLIALVLHNIYVCRRNPEGITFRYRYKILQVHNIIISRCKFVRLSVA